MSKELATEKKVSYTVRQLSEMMGVPSQTIKNSIRRNYPYLMENGKATYIDEDMATTISQDLKVSHNSNLSSSGQVLMTKKEEDMVIVNAMSILQSRVKELQPKAEAYDRLIETHNTISMGEFAKSIGWGRNTMLLAMRIHGFIDKKNMPYQKYMQYFEVRNTEKNGVNYPTTYINAKGIDYISVRLGDK